MPAAASQPLQPRAATQKGAGKGKANGKGKGTGKGKRKSRQSEVYMGPAGAGRYRIVKPGVISVMSARGGVEKRPGINEAAVGSERIGELRCGDVVDVLSIARLGIDLALYARILYGDRFHRKREGWFAVESGDGEQIFIEKLPQDEQQAPALSDGSDATAQLGEEMDLGTDGAGTYRIVKSGALAVASSRELGSTRLGKLQFGDNVEVLEIARVEEGQRIRAKIKFGQGMGWITVRSIDGELICAERVAEERRPESASALSPLQVMQKTMGRRAFETEPLPPLTHHPDDFVWDAGSTRFSVVNDCPFALFKVPECIRKVKELLARLPSHGLRPRQDGQSFLQTRRRRYNRVADHLCVLARNTESDLSRVSIEWADLPEGCNLQLYADGGVSYLTGRASYAWALYAVTRAEDELEWQEVAVHASFFQATSSLSSHSICESMALESGLQYVLEAPSFSSAPGS